MRTAVKWCLRGCAAVAVVVVFYLSVFFVPYPLFPHHIEHAGFSVYSDAELPDGFEDVLDDVRRRVDAMELHRGERPPRVFVCRSQHLFRFFVRLAGKRHAGQGLLISVAGNAFFSAPTIEAVRVRHDGRPPHSRLQGSMAAAIAHEIAHHLVFTEIGYREARRLPVWKSEGHADSQANLAPARSDPDYDIHSRVALWLDEDAWRTATGFIDRRHFGWQLLTDFLYEVRDIDFADFIEQSLTEEAVRTEMLTWFEAGADRPGSAAGSEELLPLEG